jgi:hypothetical protein
VPGRGGARRPRGEQRRLAEPRARDHRCEAAMAGSGQALVEARTGQGERSMPTVHHGAEASAGGTTAMTSQVKGRSRPIMRAWRA